MLWDWTLSQISHLVHGFKEWDSSCVSWLITKSIRKVSLNSHDESWKKKKKQTSEWHFFFLPKKDLPLAMVVGHPPKFRLFQFDLEGKIYSFKSGVDFWLKDLGRNWWLKPLDEKKKKSSLKEKKKHHPKGSKWDWCFFWNKKKEKGETICGARSQRGRLKRQNISFFGSIRDFFFSYFKKKKRCSVFLPPFFFIFSTWRRWSIFVGSI